MHLKFITDAFAPSFPMGHSEAFNYAHLLAPSEAHDPFAPSLIK
jgi:hypothetical protein